MKGIFISFFRERQKRRAIGKVTPPADPPPRRNSHEFRSSNSDPEMEHRSKSSIEDLQAAISDRERGFLIADSSCRWDFDADFRSDLFQLH